MCLFNYRRLKKIYINYNDWSKTVRTQKNKSHHFECPHYGFYRKALKKPYKLIVISASHFSYMIWSCFVCLPSVPCFKCKSSVFLGLFREIWAEREYIKHSCHLTVIIFSAATQMAFHSQCRFSTRFGRGRQRKWRVAVCDLTTGCHNILHTVPFRTLLYEDLFLGHFFS